METITPQIVLYILGIPISSTVVSTWFVMALIITIILLLSKISPNLLDMLGEFLNSMISGIMTIKNINNYLPLLGTLAIFIAISNIIGNVPILTAPTSDINTTIALSLVIFLSVHFFGIKKAGLIGYLKKLATPIFMFPFEIIGQISRTISLSLRLFGNVLSGELISAIIFGLVPLIVPLPFAFLGLFVGVLQAYVFTALSSVYIDLAIATKN